MASDPRDCDCGFTDSKDPTKSIFSGFLVVNFGTVTEEELFELFIPASYEVNQRNAPYSRNFTVDRVQLSEAGLGLTTSPSPDSEKVPSGQIFTKPATFFYGSYHANIRVGAEPGTVTAFFQYKSDTSEIDIEYLSGWEDPTLLYSVKPQIYYEDGDPSNETYQRHPWDDASAAFSQDFHDWSYVWLPDVVHFGLDADYSRNITTNVPQAPGRLALSHWSDGNPKYSGGPPLESDTVTVSSLWAVYNDTEARPLECKKATSACIITDGVLQAINPSGDNNPELESLLIVNSARVISPVSPGWLFALLLFCLFSSRRFLR